TTAATLGTHSSTNPGRLCPSRDATGQQSVTQSEDWYKSLHDAWADTTSAHGRLMVTILAGLAEFERELILARTSDGRARAKARGVRFGRPTALTSHQRAEVLQRLANGEVQADLA